MEPQRESHEATALHPTAAPETERLRIARDEAQCRAMEAEQREPMSVHVHASTNASPWLHTDASL